MTKRSRRSSDSNPVDTNRLTGALIVLLLGLVALVIVANALTSSIGIDTLLIALGTLWLAAVAILNSITRSRINGIEPQTALIALGLAWPISASTFSLIFLLVGGICLLLWARRGFRL